MAKLLYLVHRMPYPPNKGDKVRSYHLLKHLAAQHEVYLGTFVDDPDDLQHLDALRAVCADVMAISINTRWRSVASLAALLQGGPLTLRYYDNSAMHDWVARTLAAQPIAASVVFSSSMAPYAERHTAIPMLLDLVDVDSAKWAAYADNHRGPMAWLYRREGRELLAYERAAVARSAQSYLVTDKEVALLRDLAPELGNRVETSCNGVDAEQFSPEPGRPSPFAAGELALVFTGAMDYWPNVDAVCWFAQAVLPALRQRHPGLRLHVVGRSPTAAVRALAGDAVAVSGTVPDVRPYLQHAAVVVAPLRLARGVQNKVLEAMAMGRPVVAAGTCVEAIDVQPGVDILPADSADDYLSQIERLLTNRAWAEQVGAAGRHCVQQHYSWPARLAGLDRQLADLQPSNPAGAQRSVQWEPA